MLLLKISSAHAQSLLVEDNENAEKAIISHKQRAEITLLEKGRTSAIEEAPYINWSDPIIDFGILRVGVRTRKMELCQLKSNTPMILPKHEPQVGHSRRGHMRSKLHRGIGCLVLTLQQGRLLRTNDYRPKPESRLADLPLDWIIPDLPPFSQVGVDYLWTHWVETWPCSMSKTVGE